MRCSLCKESAVATLIQDDEDFPLCPVHLAESDKDAGELYAKIVAARIGSMN
jgi:hypothetical protein